MSPKAKSADFRNLSPDELLRGLQQRAAELHRKEDVKCCTAQLRLHSEIVGPAKRLVHNMVEVLADGADYFWRCGDTWS